MLKPSSMAEPTEPGPVLPRWLLPVASAVGTAYLLFLLRGALTPIFFAFLIAYVLDPVVDKFEERGMSRATGIAVMTVALVVILVGTVFLVVPVLVRETMMFAEQLPAGFAALMDRAEPALGRMGVAVPSSFDEVRAQLDGVDTQNLAEKAAAQLSGVASYILGGTVSVLAALAGLVMIPVFAAYLLYDFDRMTAAIGALVPARYRGYVTEVARDVDTILGDFMRGQLIVMLALVVLYGGGYALVGVPVALGIGVVAGLFSFIPYLGSALALIMALTLSFLHWTGWGQILGVGIVYAVVQLLESFVITPKIVGDKVGLPAVWVLFALLVGSELFGFLGVLLALPAAAVTKIFVVRGLAYYRASDFFLTGGDDTDGTAEPAAAPPAADSGGPPSGDAAIPSGSMNQTVPDGPVPSASMAGRTVPDGPIHVRLAELGDPAGPGPEVTVPDAPVVAQDPQPPATPPAPVVKPKAKPAPSAPELAPPDAEPAAGLTAKPPPSDED